MWEIMMDKTKTWSTGTRRAYMYDNAESPGLHGETLVAKLKELHRIWMDARGSRRIFKKNCLVSGC